MKSISEKKDSQNQKDTRTIKNIIGVGLLILTAGIGIYYYSKSKKEIHGRTG